MPRIACHPWRHFLTQAFSPPSPARPGLGLLTYGLFIGVAASAAAQSARPSVVIPAGTPLQVKLSQHRPSKTGPIQTQLVYPIYVGDSLALPAGISVSGRVTALEPNTPLRRDARLSGDFT